MTDFDLDARIDAILELSDWWELPPIFQDRLLELLEQMYLEGLNTEASRIEQIRQELDEPPFIDLAWDIRDVRVRELIETHAAEAVTNINSGTKFYLRRLIKEGVDEGLGPDVIVDRIQRDLFGLPDEEASKFTRDRLKSIVNYETNKAMSGAADLLRRQLGLKRKQWFTVGTDPCDICRANEAQGVVPASFKFEGVFGSILYPPAHPRYCRCVVIADETEVKALTGPIDWPMTVTEKMTV